MRVQSRETARNKSREADAGADVDQDKRVQLQPHGCQGNTMANTPQPPDVFTEGSSYTTDN